MNIVAIMAHGHDIPFFCAGTLRKYQQAGHSIFIALTTGDTVPAAAEALNVPVRLLGFTPGGLHDGMTQRAAVLTAMRWAEADVILTHSLFDGDSDHAHTAKLVADSMLIVSGKLHPADLPPVQKTPHVFYCDTVAGLTTQTRYGLARYAVDPQSFYLTPGVHSNDWFEPEAYVDVSEHMELKRQLLAQEPELARGCEAQARIRGIQMGCRYAEGFTGHQICGHVADYRLLP